MRFKGLLTLVLLFGLCQTALAFEFSLDGNLDEWGVTPGVWGAGSDWVPVPGVYYVEEDYEPGSSSDGFVDPGYGDQTFDAEAMYATRDGDNLYFAVVTGLPPEGSSNWLPSPIAIDFGSDGTYEYGIDVISDDASKVGSLYAPVSWTGGLNNWGYGTVGYLSYPVAMVDPALVLDPAYANLVYNNTGGYASSGHYVIEGFMPLTAFESDWSDAFTMHWTMGCGNDAINLKAVIPEPATMALFGLGLVGAAAARRRKTR